MDFMSTLCILILSCGIMGILCLMHYCITWRDEKIADLEDDILKIKSNRQIPTVIDGYVVYLSEYEIKHRND